MISVGLDPTKAGLVGGLRFIRGFVGGNIWGLIANYKKCHRLIVFIVCLGALLCMGAQQFIISWLEKYVSKGQILVTHQGIII